MTDDTLDAQCLGKETFPNPKIAARVAKRMAQNRSAPIQSYRCDLCSKWHVGQGQKRISWRNGKKMKRPDPKKKLARREAP